MKTSLLLGLFLLVGCSHSPAPKAPESYTITETSRECTGTTCKVVTRTLPEREVTVKPIENLPRVQGQTMGMVDDNPYATEEDDNPYAEGEKNEALLKAMKEAVERDSKPKPDQCLCQPGDPLCSCL